MALTVLLGFTLMLFYCHHDSSSYTIQTAMYSDSTTPTTTCHLDMERKSVSCTSRGLRAVPDNLSPDTRVLDLSNNHIPTLSNGSFNGLRLLMKLDLTNNNIRSIETEALAPLELLKELVLDLNNIKFTGELFRYNRKLARLGLYACGLFSFPSDAFEWLPSLEYLDLGFNLLLTLDITICHTKHLYADLTDNSFSLQPGTFNFPCQSSYISIVNNGIELINPDVIASLPTYGLYIGEEENVTI